MDPRYLQLAERAEHTASIIGNPETGIYLLLDVRQPVPPASSEFARTVVERRLRHVGVIGMVHGVPRVLLGVPIDAESIAALAHAFAQRASLTRIVAEVEQPKDDFVQFAEALWSLEDPRDS